MYGMTETANWVGGASSATQAPEDGLVGNIWGGSAAVLGPNGDIQANGSGEILVQTPTLMQGYLDSPDKTDEVFHHGWYRTGDMGEGDETGAIRLKGRARYMINVAGSKVYPEEIDLLLERHPDVTNACCFAKPDVVTGEAVAAAITLKDGAEVTGTDVLDWVRTRIREDARPQAIYVVAELARNANGKIDRPKVAQGALS